MWRFGRCLFGGAILAALFLLAACSSDNGGENEILNNNGGFDHARVTGQACVSCHDGIHASGMHQFHIISTNLCNACHSTTTWNPVVTVDHEQVLTTCGNCHNNIAATGKSRNHLSSTNECEACHLPDGNWWIPLLRVDHTHVLGTCESCHNNFLVSGKPPNHLETSQPCDVCHDVPPSAWSNLIAFNHESVQGQSCIQSGCHDGVAATGKPADTLHLNVTDNCGACHTAGGLFNPPVGFVRFNRGKQ